jgi:hypothetical protein
MPSLNPAHLGTGYGAAITVDIIVSVRRVEELPGRSY